MTPKKIQDTLDGEQLQYFVTGSTAMGLSNKASDVDIAVLGNPFTAEAFAALATDLGLEEKEGYSFIWGGVTLARFCGKNPKVDVFFVTEKSFKAIRFATEVIKSMAAYDNTFLLQKDVRVSMFTGLAGYAMEKQNQGAF